MNASPRPRPPSPRGQGSRLRDDLVDAALRVVDTDGAESLTLRAVAREAGVAAPSIYRHFANLDALTEAVVDGCFAAISDGITSARDRHADVVDRLLASCAAYIGYAENFPRRYALVFRGGPSPAQSNGTPNALAAFELLVDAVRACVDAGRSDAGDAPLAATAIWAALDGYANLRSHRPRFAWPEHAALLSHLALRLACIDPPKPSPAQTATSTTKPEPPSTASRQ